MFQDVMSCFKKHWSPFSDILKTEQLKDSSRKPTLESVAAARICSSVPSYEWPFSLRWHAVHILVSWSLWHSIRSITSNKTHTCLLASSPPINPSSLSSLLSSVLARLKVSCPSASLFCILSDFWRRERGRATERSERGEIKAWMTSSNVSAAESTSLPLALHFFPPSGLWTCSF